MKLSRLKNGVTAFIAALTPPTKPFYVKFDGQYRRYDGTYGGTSRVKPHDGQDPVKTLDWIANKDKTNRASFTYDYV